MARKLTFVVRNATDKSVNFYGIKAESSKIDLVEAIPGMATSVLLTDISDGGIGNSGGNSATKHQPIATLAPGQEIISGAQVAADVVESIISVVLVPKVHEVFSGTDQGCTLTDMTDAAPAQSYNVKTFNGGVVASTGTALGRLPVGTFPNTDQGVWLNETTTGANKIAASRDTLFIATTTSLKMHTYFSGDTYLVNSTTSMTNNMANARIESLHVNRDGTVAAWHATNDSLSEIRMWNGAVQRLSNSPTAKKPLTWKDGSVVWADGSKVYVNPSDGKGTYSIDINEQMQGLNVIENLQEMEVPKFKALTTNATPLVGQVTAMTYDKVNEILYVASNTIGSTASAIHKVQNGLNTFLGTSGDQTTSMANDGAGNVYIGGRFTSVTGVIATSIAKWNGTTWSNLGSGISGGAVNTIAVDGTIVYAGGTFSHAGGTYTPRLAKWNGSAWSSIGVPNSTIHSLAIDVSHNLYAAGAFTSIGSFSISKIAKYDGFGASWSAIGANSTINSSINTVVCEGDHVYAAGGFTVIGLSAIARIGYWHPYAWAAMGTGVNNFYVYSMDFASNGDLYIGGSFTFVNGTSMPYVAKWDGAAWSPLSTGLDSWVNKVAADNNGGVYFGGTFTNYLTYWNGSAFINPLDIVCDYTLTVNLYQSGISFQPLRIVLDARETYNQVSSFSKSVYSSVTCTGTYLTLTEDGSNFYVTINIPANSISCGGATSGFVSLVASTGTTITTTETTTTAEMTTVTGTIVTGTTVPETTIPQTTVSTTTPIIPDAIEHLYASSSGDLVAVISVDGTVESRILCIPHFEPTKRYINYPWIQIGNNLNVIVTAVGEDSDGELLIGLSTGILKVASNGNWEKYGPINNSVNAFTLDYKNRLVIGGAFNEKVMRVENNEWVSIAGVRPGFYTSGIFGSNACTQLVSLNPAENVMAIQLVDYIIKYEGADVELPCNNDSFVMSFETSKPAKLKKFIKTTSTAAWSEENGISLRLYYTDGTLYGPVGSFSTIPAGSWNLKITTLSSWNGYKFRVIVYWPETVITTPTESAADGNGFVQTEFTVNCLATTATTGTTTSTTSTLTTGTTTTTTARIIWPDCVPFGIRADGNITAISPQRVCYRDKIYSLTLTTFPSYYKYVSGDNYELIFNNQTETIGWSEGAVGFIPWSSVGPHDVICYDCICDTLNDPMELDFDIICYSCDGQNTAITITGTALWPLHVDGHYGEYVWTGTSTELPGKTIHVSILQGTTNYRIEAYYTVTC